MLVELIGYPGSGKTTFAIEAIKRSPDLEIVFETPRLASKVRHALLIAAYRAPLFSLYLLLCLASRQNVTSAHYIRMRRVHRAYLFLKSSKKDSLIILDEGAIHCLFQCLYGTQQTAVSNFFLRRVVNLIEKQVDLYVMPTMGKAEALENFSQREHPYSRFTNSTAPNELKRFLEDNSYENILTNMRSDKIRMFSESLANLPDGLREFMRTERPT